MSDSELLLENDDHEIDADRSPDLRLRRILALAVEELDSQVLLDPFEEEFNLPTGLAGLCDDFGIDGEVVRDEDQ